MLNEVEPEVNPNHNFSMYNLRQLLTTGMKANKETRIMAKSAQSKTKKSHRKSTQSLNISKLNSNS